MSLQFNYFAVGDDLTRVAEVIVGVFPELIIVPERGAKEQMQGNRAVGIGGLIPCHPNETWSLIPYNLWPEIHTIEVKQGLHCVRFQECPAIEYSPSAPVDADIVKIGRIMYAYSDDHELRKGVEELIRRLKRESFRYAGGRDLWIFSEAMHTAKRLKPWVGPDWDNPMRDCLGGGV
ncbi:MAG: hypothetical protein ISS70_19105 [Phycisphaerae bacterium]|nr:hypothetical protein [Phycisphaerae bacterium]